MLRSKTLSISVMCCVLLIVGIVAFTNLVGATSLKPPPPPPVHHAFQVSQTYVPGNPGIQPRASLAGSGPSEATFTRDDVIAFFNKHGFYAGPVVSSAHLKILTIQFVTAERASELMKGESVGRPDTALVCYVKVQGPFRLTNIRGGPAQIASKMPTTAMYGDAVFDAHTGNLLVWGVYY
ncbi:MAG TPA: hypothetical protein VJ761_08750 [Ktedonobacteraceae bacterium]|nr:hypothetical protein [Ktedonobacteraceae bacterium]